MTAKAFTPVEALKARAASIPDHVIFVVNSILASRYLRGQTVQVLQNEIIEGIAHELGEANDIALRSKVFDNHWLDFEPVYEAAGWSVKYEKPGYNENGTPYFVFTPVKEFE